jgi:hypothetical protein
MKKSPTNIGQAAESRSPDARVSKVVSLPGVVDPDGLGDVDDTPLLPADVDATGRWTASTRPTAASTSATTRC